MTEKLWYKAAQVFIRAGKFPIPLNDTVASMMKELLTEEQAKFMLLFKKRSYTLEQIKERTHLNEEECVGCGTGVDKCNVEAIELINEIAVIDENICIGCGICVHHCPSNAIDLIKTELRRVFVPPPKLAN